MEKAEREAKLTMFYSKFGFEKTGNVLNIKVFCIVSLVSSVVGSIPYGLLVVM
ncbi:hypothetical protein [Ferdinandcohnia sp. SAFN-114]|uniref:hypothetical protein n=1 Tax=Ferdinandcohnia sp. SAFN-114 TaxID=3387275 RepID=UPI003F81717C